MGSTFGQVRPSTIELVALERLEKSLHTYNARNVVTALVPSFLRWIVFIRAGNTDNHKSLHEFKFRPDPMADDCVSCPWPSEISMNKVVTSLMPSFLIGSSSFLQVARTAMKSWMVLKFHNSHRLMVGEMLWWLRCFRFWMELFHSCRLQKTAIKAWISLHFGHIPSPIIIKKIIDA